jgi:hypothetical protein
MVAFTPNRTGNELTARSVQMQQLTVAGYMKRRVGVYGHRVWRLLTELPYLQMDQIGKVAMIDLRTTRQLIYGLFRQGYLQVQEVPKSAERAPSKAFYLYKTDPNVTNCQFMADSFTAAGAALTYLLGPHTQKTVEFQDGCMGHTFLPCTWMLLLHRVAPDYISHALL